MKSIIVFCVLAIVTAAAADGANAHDSHEGETHLSLRLGNYRPPEAPPAPYWDEFAADPSRKIYVFHAPWDVIEERCHPFGMRSGDFVAACTKIPGSDTGEIPPMFVIYVPLVGDDMRVSEEEAERLFWHEYEAHVVDGLRHGGRGVDWVSPDGHDLPDNPEPWPAHLPEHTPNAGGIYHRYWVGIPDNCNEVMQDCTGFGPAERRDATPPMQEHLLAQMALRGMIVQ
jgi:hypothetical protein